MGEIERNQSDPDPEMSPSHESLWRLSLSLRCPVQFRIYAFASQLPFDSCLFCVALTKGKAEYEGGRTLKSGNASYTTLCISDCDPAVPQTPPGCFCCGNRGEKRWDAGLAQWAVFVFCFCFVFLSLWVVPFLPLTSHAGSCKLRKSLHSPLSPLPLFFSFALSPITPPLLHFSGNNLLLPFPVPEDWEIKSLLGLRGSVKIA